MVEERTQSYCKMLFLTVFVLCFVSEHQAALLQLKRECKDELEKLKVGMKDEGRSTASSRHIVFLS